MKTIIRPVKYQITCPLCGTKTTFTLDLNNCKIQPTLKPDSLKVGDGIRPTDFQKSLVIPCSGTIQLFTEDENDKVEIKERECKKILVIKNLDNNTFAPDVKFIYE